MANENLKHTPGPWKVDEISSPPHDRGVFGMDGMIVAKIYLPLNFNKQQADANACLIAAAPEILEALERLVTEHKSALYSSLEKRIANWQIAEAAIRKARGQFRD